MNRIALIGPSVTGAVNITPMVVDPPTGTGVVASVVISKIGLVVKEGFKFKGAKPVF